MNLPSFGALHAKAGLISPQMRAFTLELERVLRSSSSGTSTTILSGSGSSGSGSSSSTTCTGYVCTWDLNGTKALTKSNAYIEINFGYGGYIEFSDDDSFLLEIR